MNPIRVTLLFKYYQIKISNERRSFMNKVISGFFSCRVRGVFAVLLAGAFILFSLAVPEMALRAAASSKKDSSTTKKSATATQVSRKKSNAGNTQDDFMISLPGDKKKTTKQKQEATLVFEATIDGEGTFVIQNNVITYNHSQFDYPQDVLINGKAWDNLNEPFELDFTPDCSSMNVIEKTGRNTIEATSSEDTVELHIYDSDSSFSQYRVSMRFIVSQNAKKQTESSKEQTKKIDPIREEDKLPGVFYDIRRSSSGIRNALDGAPQTVSVEYWLKILSDFVVGHWMHSTDPRYLPIFRDLNQFYCYHSNRYDSCFFRKLSANEVLSFFDDDNASAQGWVGLHAGYVVAPFTGDFRFVGYGNDALAVHFDNQLVLDYGDYCLSEHVEKGRLGLSRSGNLLRNQQTSASLSNKDKTFKIETYQYNGLDVAKGLPIHVKKGTAYPIKIMYSNIDGNGITVVLFVEMLNANGKPMQPTKLYLFRTTSEIPSIPNFDTRNRSQSQSQEVGVDLENAPIWDVTDYRGKKLPTVKPDKDKVKKIKF